MQRSRRRARCAAGPSSPAPSPSDFAVEDYHLGRPRHPPDLNATGRKQLGLQAW